MVFWLFGMVVAMPGVIVFRRRRSGWPLATLVGWFAWVVWAYMCFKVDEHSYLLGDWGDEPPPQWDEDVFPFMLSGWFFSGIYSLFFVMLKALMGCFSQD